MTGDVAILAPGLRSRLVRLGANVAHAAAASGMPASGEVPTDRFFAFWEAIGAASPADIGLRLAAEAQPHEYDISQLAALHSPDVGTALRKLARYKRLCAPKAMAIETARGEVAIHTTYLHATRPVPPRLADASLGALLVLLQRGTGTPLVPKRVELSRAPGPARADEPMLTRFFGCPIRFRTSRDALVLDERLLGAPFVTRNDDLLQALLPGLEQRLGPRAGDSFLDSVRAVIARRMSGERPSVAKVAHELAMSTRTLQRRLGELGVSYQQVLDEVRHRAALRLLRTGGVDVAEVAFLLGFEELNSFTRAFRTWEGQSPMRWRSSTAGSVALA